ncbi:hypothetical protein BAE44_0021269 [Dichanthelium oligosanthes]|uniref:Uncharacterized protein n=1 Tax=Dichanthelium oligosanthes TaxID=888268 RepID=A0A1E5UXU6_9POAL|nr:hypothetical protein BAE44_0021269 [Dichanthelium oligosanthes]
MGHGNGPAAVDQPGCRVLPVIEEETESEPEAEGEGSPEKTRLGERRKAIVARMRELLGRAAAAQSAHSKLRSSTVATAKKWKRAVGRIQRRGKSHHQQVAAMQEDGMLSSSSSVSSHSSFSWDAVAAESCCSALSPAANCSPLLWPAFVSTPRDETAADQQRQASSPATSVLRLSCGSSSWSEDDDTRMAHWVTTDSDFVVLEL